MPADTAHTLPEAQRRVRLGITRFFASEGFAPTTQDIAVLAGIRREEAGKALELLEDMGHVQLVARTQRLSAAHPYSATPTAYWVDAGHRGWWANCAFCALGIAVISNTPVRIHCRLGAMSESAVVEASPAGLSHQQLRLHIPLPLARWHDDIRFTCANVHLFPDTRSIDEWSERFFLPRGQDVSLADAWRLAKRWYRYYLDDDWSPHSDATLKQMCAECGLKGDFWDPAIDVDS